MDKAKNALIPKHSGYRSLKSFQIAYAFRIQNSSYDEAATPWSAFDNKANAKCLFEVFAKHGNISRESLRSLV